MLDYNLPWSLDFSIRYLWKSRNSNMKFYRIGRDNHFPLGENKQEAVNYGIYDYIIALKDKDSLNSFSDAAIYDEIVKDFSKAGLADSDRYALVKTQVILPDNYAVFLFKRE